MNQHQVTMTDILVKDVGGATARMVDVGGYIMPAFPEKDAATLKRIFDEMPTFSMRDDDVMLCSFPKTGTNWLYEVLSMMLQKSAARVQTSKYTTMMEAQTPEQMERFPAPRVMNSHFNLKYLPEDLKTKQIKTVLVLRNPKDAAVSFYNHMKGHRHYSYIGEWKNWLSVYIKGEYEYGKYTDYLREWQEAIAKGPGFPLHVMYFEDLKVNGVEELNRLEKFLGLDLGEELKNEIIDACHFDKMFKEKQMPEEMKKEAFKEGFEFFRKGQIGDWKNWFTVQQNEMFDEIWAEDAKGLNFPFIYTDPRV